MCKASIGMEQIAAQSSKIKATYQCHQPLKIYSGGKNEEQRTHKEFNENWTYSLNAKCWAIFTGQEEKLNGS